MHSSTTQVYDFNAGEEPGVQHFQVSHTSPFSAGFWDVDSRGSSSGQPATTKTVNPPSFSPSTQSAADDIPLTSQSDLALDTQSPVLEASQFQDPDSLSLVRIDLAPAQGPDSLHMGSGGFQDPQGSHPIQPSVTAFVVGEVQSPVQGKLQHGMDGDFDFFSGMQSASSAVVVEAFAEDLFSDFAVPAVTEQQPLPVVISTDAGEFEPARRSFFRSSRFTYQEYCCNWELWLKPISTGPENSPARGDVVSCHSSPASNMISAA